MQIRHKGDLLLEAFAKTALSFPTLCEAVREDFEMEQSEETPPDAETLAAWMAGQNLDTLKGTAQQSLLRILSINRERWAELAAPVEPAAEAPAPAPSPTSLVARKEEFFRRNDAKKDYRIAWTEFVSFVEKCHKTIKEAGYSVSRQEMDETPGDHRISPQFFRLARGGGGKDRAEWKVMFSVSTLTKRQITSALAPVRLEHFDYEALQEEKALIEKNARRYLDIVESKGFEQSDLIAEQLSQKLDGLLETAQGICKRTQGKAAGL